jgi:leucyl aminopeptidase
MAVQINYTNSSFKNLSNLVLFVDENFTINGLKKHISSTEFSFISDLLKNSDLKKNLLIFEINSKKKIFLVSVKKDLNTSDVESLGAEFYNHLNFGRKNQYFINIDTINSSINDFASYFLNVIK